MGAAKDYRRLVPRIPPEGLRAWVEKRFQPELDMHGLVYEAEYVMDYGLSQLLDEWAKPRKRKMVRVTCSCCGGTDLLHWAQDAEHGYGFILPEGMEGDWGHVVTAAGEETVCPMCGEKVLVNKRAAVRDYYVTAEYPVMSADVLAGGELVLTGWAAQRRVSKAGVERLELLPADAYVFTPTDCVQLMGWANGYSGQGGYFVQYCRSWRQPKAWCERWGQTEEIFGLMPELVDRSCLPHCKLDVYMAPRPGARHYPVAWLRLYQLHPNAEAVLLHGLPMVLDDLIAAQLESADWEKNEKGRIDLEDLDWAQTRPAQMLRLTREELRMGRAQEWGYLFWSLFVGAKGIGERLTAEDIQNAFYLGDQHVTELIPRGQVGKSIRYLLRQCEALYAEVDEAVADPLPDTPMLLDYWTMAEALGRDLADPSVRYPADLVAAHDRAAELMRQKAEEHMAALFRVRRRALKKYAYASGGLLICPAASQRELTAEGDALHHCVGTYGKKHAVGETAIFFIRRADRPRESFYTLELDEKKLTVRQNRGLRNCARTPEVKAFEAEWLAWVQAGAPKGRDGKPVPMDWVSRKAKHRKGAA